MKRTPIIKIRPIRGVFDSDWDGIPNDQDCVWWDSRRHGFLENRRLKKQEKMAAKVKSLKSEGKIKCKKCGRWYTPGDPDIGDACPWCFTKGIAGTYGVWFDSHMMR